MKKLVLLCWMVVSILFGFSGLAGEDTAVVDVAHKDEIRRLLVSPGGKYLASLGGKQVKLWDYASGELLCTWDSPVEYSRDMAFGPDGTFLIASFYKGACRIDCATRQVKSLENVAVSGLGIGADGTWMIGNSNRENNQYDIYDTGSGALIGTISDPKEKSEQRSFAYDPKFNRFFVGYHSGNIKIFDVASKKVIQKLDAHSYSSQCLAVSGDGTLLASGSDDQSIVVFDLLKMKEIARFKSDEDVAAVAFSPDKTSLFAGVGDSYSPSWAEIWRLSDGKITDAYFKGERKGVVRAGVYAPDGKSVVVSRDGSISRWEPGAAEPDMVWNMGRKGVQVAARMKDFAGTYRLVPYIPHTDVYGISGEVDSSDGQWTVSFNPEEVKLWQRPTGRLVATWNINQIDGKVTSACFLPDSSGIIIGGNEIRTLTLPEGKIVQKFKIDMGASVMSVTRDGKVLLIAGRSSDSNFYRLAAYDLKTGKRLAVRQNIYSESRTVPGSFDFWVSRSQTAMMLKEPAIAQPFTTTVYAATAGLPLMNFPGEFRQELDFGQTPEDGRQLLDRIWVLNDTEALMFRKNEVIHWNYFWGSILRRSTLVTGKDYMPVCFSSVPSRIVLQDLRGPGLKFVAFDYSKLAMIPSTADDVRQASSVLVPGMPVKKKIWESQRVTHLQVSRDLRWFRTWVADDSDRRLWGDNRQEKVGSLVDFSVKPLSAAPKDIVWSDQIKSSSSQDDMDRFWKLFSIKSRYSITCVSQGAGDSITALGLETGEVAIYENSSQIRIGTLKLFDVSIDSVYVLNRNMILALGGGVIKLANMATGIWVAIVPSLVSNEWVAFDSRGYWDGSNNAGTLVSMVDASGVYSIDQFALQNNRPDKLMEQGVVVDQLQASNFLTQVEKRLRKAGLGGVTGLDLATVPKAEIVGSGLTGADLTLETRLSAPDGGLKSYQVWINDVPLFEGLGKPVIGKIASVTDKIELTDGDNKIEVGCMNLSGQESFRTGTLFRVEKPGKGRLFFVGFGVSSYNNPALNLRYAHKDALDLGALVAAWKGKGYTEVFSRVLVDEQVTPQSISATKDFLLQAGVDDTVILFIAGHGIHDQDKDSTYYYLTSNADLGNLAGTAADFASIETLLQGIAPRKKLFLMDTCESGEIDDTDQVQILTAAKGAGIASRGLKAVGTPVARVDQPTNMRRPWLLERDRYIYNDLARRSGAIVFSSSRGGEFSYEREDLENGLFTEFLLKALGTRDGDKNKDGTISVDELREYVSLNVAQSSSDLQHPVVDRDNLSLKFGFMVP